MPTNPFWIDQRYPGRLGVSPRPRGNDWLENELQYFKTQGVNVIVSLLEPTESSDLGLAQEEQFCRSLSLEFISFPVPDYSVPLSVSATNQLASRIKTFLAEGQSVLIHCRQGIGRSSLIAAAVLTQSGLTLPEALSQISHARGILVPETEEQKRWLVEHFGAA